MNLNSTKNRDFYPKQDIPIGQKNKDWVIENAKYFMSQAYAQDYDMYNRKNAYNYKLFLYRMLNGIIDQSDYIFVTAINGLPDYTIVNKELSPYNIIHAPIMALIGEANESMYEPLITQVNREATSKKLEVKKQLYLQKFGNELAAEYQKLGIPMANQQQMEQQQQQTPSDVEEYMAYKYRDIIEVQAANIVEYISQANELARVFDEGYLHGLTVGEELYRVYSDGTKLYSECMHPLNISYDKSQHIDDIADSDWIVSHNFKSVNEIIELFRDTMEKKDYDRLDDFSNFQQNNNGMTGRTITATSQWFNEQMNPTGYDEGQGTPIDMIGSGLSDNNRNAYGRIPVYHIEWKSIGSVESKTQTGTDPQGQPIYKKEKRKIVEAWEADVMSNAAVNDPTSKNTDADSIIILKYGLKENQNRSVDNPAKCRLSYTGTIYDNTTTHPISAVMRLVPIQVFYNAIWYKLEQLVSQASGKTIIMDAAQIPANMDKDQWTYMLKAHNVMWINSVENKINGATFNQFQEMDLSLSSEAVQGLQAILAQLTQMAEDVLGVNRQRKGDVKSSDGLGTNQQALKQSATITQYLLQRHNTAKTRLTDLILSESRYVMKAESPISYTANDMAQKFIEVNKDYQFSDFGVFTNTSAKDLKAKQTLEQLAPQMIQSQMIDVVDYISILNSNNLSGIEKKLITSTEKKKKEMQQMQQQEQQSNEKIEQSKIQHEQQMQQAKSTSDYKQATDVAKINNDIKIQEMQGTSSLEQQKIALEQERMSHEMQMKQQELDAKVQEAQSKMELESTKHQMGLEANQQSLQMDMFKEQEKLKSTATIKQKELEHKQAAEGLKMQMDSIMKEREAQLKEKETGHNMKLQEQKTNSEMTIAQEKANAEREKQAMEMKIKQMEMETKSLQQQIDTDKAKMDIMQKQMDLVMKQHEQEMKREEANNQMKMKHAEHGLDMSHKQESHDMDKELQQDKNNMEYDKMEHKMDMDIETNELKQEQNVQQHEQKMQQIKQDGKNKQELNKQQHKQDKDNIKKD